MLIFTGQTLVQLPLSVEAKGSELYLRRLNVGSMMTPMRSLTKYNVDLIDVVDDEANIRETVAFALRREGYEVRMYADGVEAWSAFQAMTGIITLSSSCPASAAAAMVTSFPSAW